MSLPLKADRLVAVLEMFAADPGASENEARMARAEVERLRDRATSSTTERARSGRERPLRLGPGAEPRPLRAGQSAPEPPLRILPPIAVVGRTERWAIALGASLAEAVGARLVASEGPAGTCLAFAGAGPDPELATASWSLLYDQARGRSNAWCEGFAVAIDERLIATIERPDVRARVERVIAWLDADPITGEGDLAPALDVVGKEGVAGVRAGRKVSANLPSQFVMPPRRSPGLVPRPE